jgi:two-component system OmpR family response regulator
MRAPHRLSVLVVDDYPDAADTLADLLHLYGHRVTVARTAAEALAAAEGHPPDVVVLELRLPDLDGWHLARRLRSLAEWGGRRLLVIAATGCGMAEGRWRSAEAGVDLHLVKPADPALLTGLLARFAAGPAPAGRGDEDTV